MKNFFNEFKNFINRGSVLDLAVGVVLATAFGAIVNSVINNLVMPLIGFILGGINFSTLSITLREATENSPALVFGYGAVIQATVNFLAIAFVVFVVVVKGLQRNKKAPEPEAPKGPTSEELLSEILQELKKR